MIVASFLSLCVTCPPTAHHSQQAVLPWRHGSMTVRIVIMSGAEPCAGLSHTRCVRTDPLSSRHHLGSAMRHVLQPHRILHFFLVRLHQVLRRLQVLQFCPQTKGRPFAQATERRSTSPTEAHAPAISKSTNSTTFKTIVFHLSLHSLVDRSLAKQKMCTSSVFCQYPFKVVSKKVELSTMRLPWLKNMLTLHSRYA